MDQNKPQETAQDQEQIAGSNRSKLTRSKLIPKNKNKTFKLGRPSKYDPKLCKGIIDFFTQDLYHQRIKSTITQKNGSVVENYELVPNPPLFLAEYGYSIGVDVRTLERWAKTKPDFCRAFMRVKQMTQEHIIKLANMGLFNSNFATFTMKNISHWRDKKDLELSGKVDSQIFFASMLTNSKEAIQNERLVLGAN
jgi:hypothetical protein